MEEIVRKSKCSYKRCNMIGNSRFICRNCLTKEYCSKECQKRDAKNHFKVCQIDKEGRIAIPKQFFFRITNRTPVEEELFLYLNFTSCHVNFVLYDQMKYILQEGQSLAKKDKEGKCDMIICHLFSTGNILFSTYKNDPFSESCDYCIQTKIAQDICNMKKNILVAIVVGKKMFYRKLNFPAMFEVKEDKTKDLTELDFKKYNALIDMMDDKREFFTLNWLNSEEQLQMNNKIVSLGSFEPLYLKIFSAAQDREMFDFSDDLEESYDSDFIENAIEKFEKKLTGGAAFVDIQGTVHSSCTYYIIESKKMMRVAFVITEDVITNTVGYQRLCNFLIIRAREMNCKTIVTYITPEFKHMYFWRAMGFSLNLENPLFDFELDCLIRVHKLGVTRYEFHTSPIYMKFIASKSVDFNGKRMAMYMRI